VLLLIRKAHALPPTAGYQLQRLNARLRMAHLLPREAPTPHTPLSLLRGLGVVTVLIDVPTSDPTACVSRPQIATNRRA
jgi:hypothetical protein